MDANEAVCLYDGSMTKVNHRLFSIMINIENMLPENDSNLSEILKGTKREKTIYHIFYHFNMCPDRVIPVECGRGNGRTFPV